MTAVDNPDDPSVPCAPAPAIAEKAAVFAMHNKVEPILILLFLGMMIFAGLLIFVEWKFKDDGQLFQVVAGLLAGFSGSFFTRLKPRTDPSEKG